MSNNNSLAERIARQIADEIGSSYDPDEHYHDVLSIINSELAATSLYCAGLERAVDVLQERAALWRERWSKNIRPECKEEADARLNASEALAEDVLNAIQSLITTPQPAPAIVSLTEET